MPSNPNNCNNCGCTPNPLDSGNWESESSVGRSSTSTPTVAADESPSGGVCLIGFEKKSVGKCWSEKTYNAGGNLAEGTNCKKEDIIFGITNPAFGATIDQASGVVTFGDDGADITVTVKCGETMDTMRLVYMKITTETVAKVPVPRDRKKLGVCEDTVVTVTPGSGSLTWQIIGAGSLTGLTGHKQTYSAPDRSGESSIGITMSEPRILCFVNFVIIEPDAVEMYKFPGSEDFHKEGWASAGFCAKMRLLPEDVSFSKIGVREGTCVCQADGYFAIFNGKPHPIGPWLPVKEGSQEHPSEVVGQDIVRIANDSTDYGTGLAVWNIPWEFTGAAENPKEFTTLTMLCTSDSSGTVNISKGGYGVTKAVEDPDSGFWCPPQVP